jgi:mono/diheme cytochrome c family protein
VNEEQKKAYLEEYKSEKPKGKVLSDIIYKDRWFPSEFSCWLSWRSTLELPMSRLPTRAIHPCPQAEWCSFLFQLLPFPGQIEDRDDLVPTIAILALLLLLYDRSPFGTGKRKFAVSVMSAVMIGIVGLTAIAAATTPPAEDERRNHFAGKDPGGQDLYSVQCVECHRAEGEGGEIKGVEGLEGVVLNPLNSGDVLYTRTDVTVFLVIYYGQQDLGMPPFVKGYGGELSRADINALVTFLRYSWDDRAELPEEVAQASAIPELPGRSALL